MKRIREIIADIKNRYPNDDFFSDSAAAGGYVRRTNHVGESCCLRLANMR
jgi:hypothetical protein